MDTPAKFLDERQAFDAVAFYSEAGTLTPNNMNFMVELWFAEYVWAFYQDLVGNSGNCLLGAAVWRFLASHNVGVCGYFDQLFSRWSENPCTNRLFCILPARWSQVVGDGRLVLYF